MGRPNRDQIEKALLEAAAIPAEKRELLLREKQATGKSLAGLLIEKELLGEETAATIMEELLNIPRINLYNHKLEEETVQRITADMARRYRVVPLGVKGEKLYLAMADPLDLAAIDDVAMMTGLEVCPVIAGEKAVSYTISHYYDPAAYPVPEEREEGSAVKETGAYSDPAPSAEDAPVIKLVNSLIERALEEGASDIHLEPAEEKLRIRMRLDGALHDLAVPGRYKKSHIISRVKIMANLDIAEKRLAQDGNIHYHKAGQEVNLRVSTMPTVHGEKVVIRILDKQKIILPLDRLGFSPESYRLLQRLLFNRSGMILVTGPTGGGKTTTLYSALHYLNSPAYNIITVEDPVEYQLKGINQVPVNRRINRTFANTLRSILRQDPDIIMIGEIRDLETAKIATQAALTGHLVLSTLHTGSAAGAVTRLTDMGLEPFMVTASMVGVIAQRLIRKNCPQCLAGYRLKAEEKELYRGYFEKDPPARLYRGSGCRRCNHTGYRGRTSIQELLVMSRELQALILRQAPAAEIHSKAVEQGMQPLVAGGLRCLEAGVTTPGEVVRATFNSLFDSERAEYAEKCALFDERPEKSD